MLNSHDLPNFISWACAKSKWMNIGKFEATAPFGVESIQLMASKDDPVSRLPQQQLDKKTELEVISTSTKEGVTKTRALKCKEDKAYQAETVLMFTTMAKTNE